MNRPKQLVLGGVALAGTVALSIGGAYVTPPAQAATGTPYTVDGSGITLTDGTTFQDNGHVNIEVEGVGQINFHFESKCIAPQANPGDRPECFQDAITRHDMAQFIGQENIPWSAFGLTTDFCITWVQISHENPHFGADFGSKFCVTGNGGCVVDTIHHDAQYKYSRTIPEQNHVENKYKQTGKVYTVEHKVTGLTNNATTNTSIVSWYGTIGAVYSATYDKWQLPDDVVNAAGVNPFNVAKTGSVDLYFYGYPGHATVPYDITAIEVYSTQPAGSLFYTVDNITLYYTGSGNTPSTSSGDAVYTATSPGSPWVTFGTPKTVVDAPSKVVYYITRGGESDTNTDANWTTDTPGAPWIKIADVKKDAYDVYVYGPCPPYVCPAITAGPTATEQDLQGWGFVGTRTNGDHEFGNDGATGYIKLFTTDSANPGNSLNKSTLYRDNTEPMATSGEPSVEFGAGSGSKPGLQYGADLDNDGVIDTILVSEPWVPGYGNSWSAFAPPGATLPQFVKDGAPHTGGGKGSNWWGDWTEWANAFPNAKGANYLGLSLGGGVYGSWEVMSYTAGCIKYTFDHEDKVIPTPLAPPSATSDCVSDGVRPAAGPNGEYDRPDEGPGDYTLTYTAPAGETYEINGVLTKTVTYPVSVPSKLPGHTEQCPTIVTPVIPIVTVSVCLPGDKPSTPSYMIVSTPGLNYLVNGKVTAAGRYYPKAGETVIVTAEPIDATYKLSDAAFKENLTDKLKVTSCSLAYTGVEILALVLFVLIAGAIGTLLVVGGYRRRKGAPVM